MKHALKVWDELKVKLADKHVMLFLDYDGTLAPIAETPDKALIPVSTKLLLERLARIDGCQVAIVSGRALRDVKQVVGIENIIYVGNHGFEIQGGDVTCQGRVQPRVREVFERVKREISKELLFFRGAFLEDKDLSFSVHYRKVDEDKVPILKSLLNEVTHPFRLNNEICVGSGKKVLEIRPPVDWNKGRAVSWLMMKQEAFANKEIFPIYIGDDITDQDAFAAIRERGLAIAVGNPRLAHAQYYLHDPSEVREFLQLVYDQFQENDFI